MKVDIMGQAWTIEERCEKEDKLLADCDGYTDWTVRMIVVEREAEGNLNDMEEYIKKVKRHEIVHAYLFECGLAECSGEAASWAQSETMVDWLARVGPRLYKTWEEAEAI